MGSCRILIILKESVCPYSARSKTSFSSMWCADRITDSWFMTAFFKIYHDIMTRHKTIISHDSVASFHDTTASWGDEISWHEDTPWHDDMSWYDDNNCTYPDRSGNIFVSLWVCCSCAPGRGTRRSVHLCSRRSILPRKLHMNPAGLTYDPAPHRADHLLSRRFNSPRKLHLHPAGAVSDAAPCDPVHIVYRRSNSSRSCVYRARCLLTMQPPCGRLFTQQSV